MSAIKLTQEIIDQFLKEAEAEYPHECCGFILGKFYKSVGEGMEYLSAKNTKTENRERRFLIDPLAYQSAEDYADEKQLSIIGIVHSHPDHPDRPSEFDRNHALPGFSYIIIAVDKGKAVSFRSWQLSEDRTIFNEENITNKETQIWQAN